MGLGNMMLGVFWLQFQWAPLRHFLWYLTINGSIPCSHSKPKHLNSYTVGKKYGKSWSIKPQVDLGIAKDWTGLPVFHGQPSVATLVVHLPRKLELPVQFPAMPKSTCGFLNHKEWPERTCNFILAPWMFVASSNWLWTVKQGNRIICTY